MPHPLFFFDVPVLDCSVTAIPGSGSATLEVIARTDSSASHVMINDGIAQYVGLYIGVVGAEVLAFVIHSGSLYQHSANVHMHCRVSLRSMDTVPITRGSVCCTFFGERRGR